MKKLLLGLGSVTAALTPVAAVISCADKENAKDATKTDATKTDATKTDENKPTDKVNEEFIKKIQQGDKGFLVEVTIEQDTMKFYVSETNAKTNSKISANGQTITLPPISIGAKSLKVRSEDGHEAPINNIEQAPAGAYVIGDVIAKTTDELAEIANYFFEMENEEGPFKFQFTDATKETQTPVLTDVSKKAFEKIFTNVGLTLTNVTFERNATDPTDIIITPTITLAP